MAAEARASELAQATGLKPVGGRAFGRYKGHPAMVSFMTAGRALTALKVSPEVLAGLAAIDREPNRLESMGFKRSMLRADVAGLLVVYELAPPLQAPKAQETVAALDILVRLVDAAGPALGTRCANCLVNPGAPMLVNSAPTQLCKACYDRMFLEHNQLLATAAARKPDLRRGLAFGFIGALIGALLWGAVGAATGYLFGLLALVLGYLVAWAMNKGSHTINSQLIVAAVLLTVLAVFMGDFVWVVFEELKAGYDVTAANAAFDYWWYLSHDPGGAAISYMFGMFGVYGAARTLHTVGKQQVPKLEVIT